MRISEITHMMTRNIYKDFFNQSSSQRILAVALPIIGLLTLTIGAYHLIYRRFIADQKPQDIESAFKTPCRTAMGKFLLSAEASLKPQQFEELNTRINQVIDQTSLANVEQSKILIEESLTCALIDLCIKEFTSLHDSIPHFPNEFQRMFPRLPALIDMLTVIKEIDPSKTRLNIDDYLQKPGFNITIAAVLAEKIPYPSYRFRAFEALIKAYLNQSGFNITKALSIAEKILEDRNRVLEDLLKTYLNQPGFDLDIAASIAEKFDDSLGKNSSLIRIIEAYIKRPEFDINKAVSIAEKSSSNFRKDSSLNAIIEAYIEQPKFDVNKAVSIAEKMTSDQSKSTCLDHVITVYIKQKKFDVSVATSIADKIPIESRRNVALRSISEASQ